MECMDTTDGVMALFRHIQRTAVRCGMDEPGCFQVGGRPVRLGHHRGLRHSHRVRHGRAGRGKPHPHRVC